MTLASAAVPHRRFSPPATAELMKIGAVALLAVYAAAVVLAIQAGAWLVDPHGAPGRFDFAEFWAAGRMAVLGQGPRAYDWNALAALLRAKGTHVFDATGFPFFYPPPVLLALVPLGLSPFAVAAAIWLATGAAAWARLSRRICADASARWALAASPAVFLCLMVGQTGLLVAVMAGGALVLLPRRPVLAGLLLAGVAMKPQTALLFPLALLAAGRWKTLFACAGALAALTLVSVATFGPEIWMDWLRALHPGAGAPAPLAGLAPAKLQSVYGLLEVLGLGKGVAMAGQGACALMAAGWVVWLWRGDRPATLKSAGLCAAALMASPYSAAYDLPITTVALAFLFADAAARQPIGRAEGAALATAYLLPLLFPVAPFPYGPAVCVILCAAVWSRSRRPTGEGRVAVRSLAAA